jgi:hypothetical protein
MTRNGHWHQRVDQLVPLGAFLRPDKNLGRETEVYANVLAMLAVSGLVCMALLGLTEQNNQAKISACHSNY